MSTIKRVVVIILDGAGCGKQADSSQYNESCPDTLGHISRDFINLDLPNLELLGLGRIVKLNRAKQNASKFKLYGSWGKLIMSSKGKDTTAGHWEIMGLPVVNPFLFIQMVFQNI